MFEAVSFPDRLSVEHISGSNWIMLAPYRCLFGRKGSAGIQQITVPEGFEHDFASVPRIFRSLIPVIGDQNGPAIVHDWCYANLWRTRAESDALFLTGLKAKGVNWFRRNAMYLAVRSGGWVLWNARVRKQKGE